MLRKSFRFMNQLFREILAKSLALAERRFIITESCASGTFTEREELMEHLPRRKEELPVDLYLIRHADALALGERGITNDEERPLSEKGEAQSDAVAKALAQRGIVLDKLYTSPLLRARQTAEIMLRVWAKPEL